MRALHPMTDEERDFAEEWHPLVFEFLHSQRLSEVDFYDVAVFGFISAVQQFVSGNANVEFIAMAKRSMKDAVLREAEYNSRQKRSGVVLSLDCGTADCEELELCGIIPDTRQDTATQVESKVMTERARNVATKKEAAIIPFVAHGYHTQEIAQHFDLSTSAVTSRMYRFRQRARAAAMG